MSRARGPEPIARLRVIVAPINFEVDGCIATLLESLEYETLQKEKRYLVAVKVKCKSIESPVFRIDARTEDELVWKLKAEIARAKLMQAASL